MKKHVSTVVFGCLGLCVGFTLCYVYIAIPQREANLTAPPALPIIEPWTTTVKIANDRSLFIGDERIETSGLSTIIKAQGNPVVIRAARNADFSIIAAIIDACKAAGMQKVAFVRATAE